MPYLRVILLAVATATAATAGSQDLGKTDFPTSGAPAAQEHFLRGVLLLHSFEYPDAREAFRAAREVEPGFAMAAWGEAMTHNHPIWLRESLEEGRAALKSLAPTTEERLAKAPTEREKGYLRAVEILFGEGDKRWRDDAYRVAMAALSARFPDDLDAAAFHSLAILGTCHDGRDTAAYMRAAAVAEEVFARNPEHPGAAHYLIHSYDDPVHAPLGLRPARVYSGIAPAAVHALHMPSHVFLALGLWDETAASNEDSWEASLAQAGRKSYHALLWLEYAYLQQGRYRDARRLLTIMEEDTGEAGLREGGSSHAAGHLAYMRAHYLVETRRWDEEVMRPDPKDLELRPAATVLFTDGLAALHRGELEAAEQHLAALRQRRQDVLAAATEGTDASGYSRTGGVRTLEAQVMELQLEALLDLAHGKGDSAVEKLRSAAGLEGDAPFGFGPPVPAKPSLELFGEVLLELGRHAEAREQLEKALARTPRRVQSLLALGQAVAELEESDVAEQTRSTLRQIRHRADADVAEPVAAPASR